MHERMLGDESRWSGLETSRRADPVAAEGWSVLRLSAIFVAFLVSIGTLGRCAGRHDQAGAEWALDVGDLYIAPVTGCFQFDPLKQQAIAVLGEALSLTFTTNRLAAFNREGKHAERDILRAHPSRFGVSVYCEPFQEGLAMRTTTDSGETRLKLFDYNLAEVTSLPFPPPNCRVGAREIQWVQGDTFFVPCPQEGKVVWFYTRDRNWDLKKIATLWSVPYDLEASCVTDQNAYFFRDTKDRRRSQVFRHLLSNQTIRLEGTVELDSLILGRGPLVQFRCVGTPQRLIGWYPANEGISVVSTDTWSEDSHLKSAIETALSEWPRAKILGMRTIQSTLWIAVSSGKKIHFVRVDLR
jgi:hypothetical protein